MSLPVTTAPNGRLSSACRESNARLSATGSVIEDGAGPGSGVSAGRSASRSVGAPSGIAAGVSVMRAMPVKFVLRAGPLRTSATVVPALSEPSSSAPKSASGDQSSSATLKLCVPDRRATSS